jgi:hypothetical protein
MAAYTIKQLVTAIAINTGGRNGHSKSTDHSVNVNLSVRKEMGGPGLRPKLPVWPKRRAEILIFLSRSKAQGRTGID